MLLDESHNEIYFDARPSLGIFNKRFHRIVYTPKLFEFLSHLYTSQDYACHAKIQDVDFL